MRFDPITGSEVQIGSFQVAIHETDSLQEKLQELHTKLEKSFEGETAHRITRVSYQRGAASFFANAGHEEQMEKDIQEYIREVIESPKEYYPFVFVCRTFVSYSPLRAVEKDEG